MSLSSRTPLLPVLLLFGSAAMLILSGGCTTLTNPLSSQSRVERYLAKNPGRPPAVQQALRDGTLQKGMNPQEVKLCWGTPNEKDMHEEDGVKGEIWSYVDSQKGGIASDHGSSLFDYSIPLGRAVFTTTSEGLTLSEWTIYGDEDTSESAAQSEQSTGQVQPKAKKAKPTPVAAPAAPEPPPPEVTVNVDLSRWPALQVTGILKSGSGRVALINKALVSVGESIEGVTVVAVSSSGVYLRYGSETICLAKGKETRPPPLSRRAFFQ